MRSLDIHFVFFSTQIIDTPGECNKSTKGKQVVIKDRAGEAKLFICDENEKIFCWTMIVINMRYPCCYVFVCSMSLHSTDTQGGIYYNVLTYFVR